MERRERRTLIEGPRVEFMRSQSQANAPRRFHSSYYTVESFLILLCLTVSLLILPLILPPLPPPPFLLLFIPICMLFMLLFMACMPSRAQDVTSPYLECAETFSYT
ncbi:auxin-regulated protein involved in organ size [Musa troglodytarum]|uniref:Auxin-regulated protein involved in organ size n=1 Tax=Musa troglodytarum TaxID=320322 RepID=A0A9E7EC67_9LILI|nr:auxin-regulated protein involved in organ size [Musa troglodytarum]